LYLIQLQIKISSTSKSLIQPKKEEDIQKKNEVDKMEVSSKKTDSVKCIFHIILGVPVYIRDSGFVFA
jgi:hypothetical protein